MQFHEKCTNIPPYAVWLAASLSLCLLNLQINLGIQTTYFYVNYEKVAETFLIILLHRYDYIINFNYKK